MGRSSATGKMPDHLAKKRDAWIKKSKCHVFTNGHQEDYCCRDAWNAAWEELAPEIERQLEELSVAAERMRIMMKALEYAQEHLAGETTRKPVWKKINAALVEIRGEK